MKKLTINIKRAAICAALLGLTFSCTKDLNREPFIESTSLAVYKDPANYKPLLAKIYAGLAVTGQEGPTGKPDIPESVINEGESQYIRNYWGAQELTTDEAVVAWKSDGTLVNYHTMDWTSSGDKIRGLYVRLIYQVVVANEFIRETTDAKMSGRGISIPEIKAYRAEARFLRALSYYHALDLFGNVAFVTENDPIGSFFPKQTNRTDLYNYVESELKAIEGDLVDARKNEYGRADKAAAWMVLAKLYLNAKVYIGQDKNTEALTYLNKVISSGYSLEGNYKNLFLADNHKSGENIFTVNFDGTRTKTYGGTTFLVHASVGGKMNAADYGIDGGWAGLRTTKQFVAMFDDARDSRAMFFKDGQNLEIDDITNFPDGYAVGKYKNLTSTGAAGSNPTFVDTDFPMFRLADAYLMYAEAVLRNGTGGDRTTALNYVNLLRKRAGASQVSTIDLDFILNERARELYWEGHRRTDLIRYGKFTTGTYLWAWKGGIKAGKAVEDFRNIFPIPAADITANPNLKQNSGY